MNSAAARAAVFLTQQAGDYEHGTGIELSESLTAAFFMSPSPSFRARRS